MSYYLIISRGRNSYGNRISIRAELETATRCYQFPEVDFYQYSEREAVAKYRAANHLEHKHLTRIYI